MTFDNIVLYDGDCGFCNFWVQWILKRDRKGRFRFAPLQSGYGQEYLRSRGLPAENFSTLYFLKNGRRYTKMYAVIEIGRTLGGRLPRSGAAEGVSKNSFGQNLRYGGGKQKENSRRKLPAAFRGTAGKVYFLNASPKAVTLLKIKKCTQPALIKFGRKNS